MDARRIRKACEAKLRTLSLPRPFTVQDFCEALARDRGRPLKLVPITGNVDGPCGLWICTVEADYVFHQVATSPFHQEHIILHELAHMIFDHAVMRVSADRLMARLFPDLAPDVVAKVLARTSYSTEQEQEAETLAGLLGGLVDRRPVPPDANHTLARAADVFGPGA